MHRSYLAYLTKWKSYIIPTIINPVLWPSLVPLHLQHAHSDQTNTPKPSNWVAVWLALALSAHLQHFVVSDVQTNSTLCCMWILNFLWMYWHVEDTSFRNKQNLSFVLLCRTTFLNCRTHISKMVVGRVLMTPNCWQPLF